MATYAQGGVSVEDLKGTKTETNLHTALSGESQAYLRYRWFEQKAKTDGFVEISQIFAETAENEKAHAEIWFKLLVRDVIFFFKSNVMFRFINFGVYTASNLRWRQSIRHNISAKLHCAEC